MRCSSSGGPLLTPEMKKTPPTSPKKKKNTVHPHARAAHATSHSTHVDPGPLCFSVSFTCIRSTDRPSWGVVQCFFTRQIPWHPCTRTRDPASTEEEEGKAKEAEEGKAKEAEEEAEKGTGACCNIRFRKSKSNPHHTTRLASDETSGTVCRCRKWLCKCCNCSIRCNSQRNTTGRSPRATFFLLLLRRYPRHHHHHRHPFHGEIPEMAPLVVGEEQEKEEDKEMDREEGGEAEAEAEAEDEDEA